MNLKQYLIPQTLKRFRSQYNNDIELVAFSGSTRLDMGGLTQSGEIIEKIWKKALDDLLPQDFSPHSILLLGFGAGSAAHLVSRRWPKAHITGVELDPVVIDIARKHFKINSIPHLTLHNQDALDFVNQQDSKLQFDLTLVDCYLGDQFPPQLESLKFVKKLTRLSPFVIINRLFWGKYQSLTLDFHHRLKPHFDTSTTRTTSNYLISIQKQRGVGD